MAKKKRILRICAKTCDLFNAKYIVDDKEVTSHDGYVPEFMPEEHYGDYVELDIDIDSGLIVNWKTPTEKELKSQLNGE